MQEYDVGLKLLLQGSAPLTLRELTGTAIAKWLDVELPKVQNLRLDLLGQTVEGHLIHLELQSSNDAAMPFRMIEYCLGVRRLFGQFPRQVLLYVGEAPMRMQNELHSADLSFQYRLIDIRTLDGDHLLDSGELGDSVIAILAQLRDHKEAVHKVVERIASLAMAERETALGQLLILAGLRHLSEEVEQERRKMPIDLDIRDHELLGPMIREAERQAQQKGLQEGRHEGRQEGELAVVRRVMEKRFGALPRWATEKLAELPVAALEDLSERLLNANSLEELLR
jgi:predicted transposase YdaD